MVQVRIIKADYNKLQRILDATADNRDALSTMNKQGRLSLFFAEFTQGREHFLAVTHAQKILGALTLAPQKDPARLHVEQICVDPAHQRSGYAKRILKSTFRYAVNRNHVLDIGSFMEDGFDAMTHTLATLHPEFPALKIRYTRASQDPVVINGCKPYVLVRDGTSNCAIPRVI